VRHDHSHWVAGAQDAWVRWPDGRWRALVAHSGQYEWGLGNHLRLLPAEHARQARGVIGAPPATSAVHAARGWQGRGVDAAAVVAIVAAVIAAAAALATFQQATSARQQTELQRQMRVDSTQSYVFVDFRMDKAQAALVSVHLENRGPTVATNVRLT
jgi:hypothetical protein